METSPLKSASATELISFYQFLEHWNQDYKNKLHEIALFNPSVTKDFSLNQKQLFAKIFYHIRGHFNDFLWYIGNHDRSEKIKKVVLDNIAEEFGGNTSSHEQLYFEFASSIDVDLKYEMLNEKNYLPFVKEFNKGHLKWLITEDLESRIAAFSAYERLDNVDYGALVDLVNSFNVPQNAKIFFIIHSKADHFDRLVEVLLDIWSVSEVKVKNAFNFIFEHQIKMWQALSDVIVK